MASTHASPLFEAYKNSAILWRNAHAGGASVQLSPETLAAGALAFLSPSSFRHVVVCNSYNSMIPKESSRKKIRRCIFQVTVKYFK